MRAGVGGGTKMTYRYYLQDMAYAVALQGPHSELQALAEALQNPVWDLYLGRKTCVPTEFVCQGVHENVASRFVTPPEMGLDGPTPQEMYYSTLGPSKALGGERG